LLLFLVSLLLLPLLPLMLLVSLVLLLVSRLLLALLLALRVASCGRFRFLACLLFPTRDCGPDASRPAAPSSRLMRLLLSFRGLDVPSATSLAPSAALPLLSAGEELLPVLPLLAQAGSRERLWSATASDAACAVKLV
jgi:hypothetical protein